MKMLTLALAVCVSTTAFSQENDTISKQATNVTLAPTAVIGLSSWCTVNFPDNENGATLCALSMTLGATSLAISVLVALKEEIQNVEPDAYGFLAGEPMTLALEAIIAEIREKAPELHEKNDQELVAMLVASLSL